MIGFVLFGGLPLLRRRADEQPEPTDATDATDSRAGATDSRAGATAVGGSGSGGSVGLVGLAVGTLVFDLDVGLVAITVALVLALISPPGGADAQARWEGEVRGGLGVSAGSAISLAGSR